MSGSFEDRDFDTKDGARQAVWTALEEEGAARFPFPPEGRIPNFAGSREAAERLLASAVFEGAERIKVNPDAPQRHVRHLALVRGIQVYVPTPRLKGGFKKLDPEEIGKDDRKSAAALSKMDRWAVEVAVEHLPAMDLMVAGSVAVTRDGRRCGKGEGYSDLEYAILRELGHPPAPVVTTVHPLQLVGGFPTDSHDLPLSLVVTPEEVIEVSDPPPAPGGIDWDLLSEEDLEEMPVLRRLKEAVS